MASPGDVTHERELALAVLDQLPYEPSFRSRITIEEVAWDKKGAGAPILANLTPQDSIQLGLPKPSECDIVVVIFWSRMGTPLPAQYRKKDGSRYQSGTEWEYEDAISANEQTGRPEVLLYRRIESVLLDPDDPKFDENYRQYSSVRTFFDSFVDLDGSITTGYNSYKVPSEFREQLDHHLKSIVERLLRSPQSQLENAKEHELPPIWPTSPFPGLRAFTSDDAPIFFGREHETDILVDRIEHNSFVAVVGASGSGKSSLVGAGLIPRLNLTTNYHGYVVVQMTPDYLGSGDPFAALAASLLRDLTGLKIAQLAQALREDSGLLGEIGQNALLDSPNDQRFLLFIDQFEELFATVNSRFREPFMEMIARATECEQIRIVATLRGDFYGKCVEVPKLAKLLEDSTYPLPIPGMAALYEMITRPAARADLVFDEGLAQRILNDTGNEPGSLALMAYTLDELYRLSGESKRLTHEAYEEIGGVQGAIGKRSETIFMQLHDNEQASLPHVFRELVEVDERGTATRQRASLHRVDLNEDSLRFVDAFTNARLLVQSKDDQNAPYIEVAHEALLRSWERLAAWIRDTQDDLRLLRQVRTAAEDWDRVGRRDDFLWSQERLEPVYAMRERLQVEFEPAVQEFVRPEAERLLDEIKSHRQYFRQRPLIERLAQIGPTSIPALIQSLQYAVVKSSKRDIYQILSNFSKHSIPILIQSCGSENIELRRGATEALSRVSDKRAVGVLISALDDIDVYVRRHATLALGNLGDLAAIEPLIRAFSDKDPGVRKFSAIQLASFGTREILRGLSKSLESLDKEVRALVAYLLGVLGSAAERAPRNHYSYVSRRLFAYLSEFEHSYELLDEALFKAQGKLRDVIASSPAYLGLIATLRDKDKQVRKNAAEALGAIADPSSISALTEALGDKDPGVRRHAVASLGHIFHDSVIPILVSALESSFTDVRSLAAKELGELGDKSPNARSQQSKFGRLRKYVIKSRAAVSLLKALEDSDINVRRNAAEALGRISDQSAGKLLVNALQDKDPELRRNAARALGKLGDKAAAEVLVEALKDADVVVRDNAVTALANLRSSNAVPELSKLLEDVSPDMTYYEQARRILVVNALMRIKDPSAVPMLIRVLNNSRGELFHVARSALEHFSTREAKIAIMSIDSNRT